MTQLPPKRHETSRMQQDINDLIDRLDGIHVAVTIDPDSESGVSIADDQILYIPPTADMYPDAGADIRVTDSTVVSRAGNGVLLFSADGTVLAEYAATSTGLGNALTAASSGDIVEFPAVGITANVTVPAGVTLCGMGWNSVLTGALTLAAGACAEHLRVYQSENDMDDVIGVIGPASGTATIRDVQISIVQAGNGKALGLLSNGGTLRAYECEVWVNGAAGSAWGVAAATGGTVEINQGQVKAWIEEPS
jgi:hypothetical protein